MFNYQDLVQSLMNAQQELNTAIARDFEVRAMGERRIVVNAHAAKAKELFMEAMNARIEFNRETLSLTEAEKLSSMQNVDTFNGWRNRGFQVRAGETATKIDGTDYFHFTQTTDFGL